MPRGSSPLLGDASPSRAIRARLRTRRLYIHCTDGREAISIVLTQYYKEDGDDWLILSIDKNRIAAPVRYEDPAGIFPHIYGPLNRDAIVDVRPIGRAPDGTFLLPG